MYKILINDGLQKTAIEELINLGFYVVDNHYNKEVLGERLKEYDVLVVRSDTKVTEDFFNIAATGKLKLIVRAGVGVDNIDVKYAEKLGIEVRNTPNASSNSVAELALAHMFSIARFMGVSNYSMRNGTWDKKKYKGVELSGKILGIIGMGRIGKVLAKKAEAIGMNVVYYTIEGKYNDLKYNFLSLEDVIQKSDFISLHVPYDSKNGALIGKEQFDIMKNGVYIVNCSRGKVIDENALLEALNSGKVAGAGIDVFEQEPTKNQELVTHPNVSCTPHIGASTIEAQDRIGKEVVLVIKEFFKSK